MSQVFPGLNLWPVDPGTLCCCSVAQPCLTLCDPMAAARQASLSFTISWSLLRLTPVELMLASNHRILLSPSPPAFNLFQHQGLL